MDLKTLRLASLQLTEALLDRFVRYQGTLLEELARAPHDEWSGRYAFAHGAALKASALDAVELGKLKAMIGEFCGKRSAALEIAERVQHAQRDVARAAAANLAPAGKQLELINRARLELPRLDDLSALEERYGAQAIALLRSREAELLRLHRELARAEGTGHVHVSSPATRA